MAVHVDRSHRLSESELAIDPGGPIYQAWQEGDPGTSPGARSITVTQCTTDSCRCRRVPDNGRMSVDTGRLPAPAAPCQFASTRWQSTSTVRQLTSARGGLPSAGELCIAPMSVRIGLLRIRTRRMSPDIDRVRIAATLGQLTSPRCDLTSARCHGPPRRLPLHAGPCDMASARGRPSRGVAVGERCLPTLTRRCCMPRFPRTEADIAALAVLVTDGLEQAAQDFPAPPVPAEERTRRWRTWPTA